mmetsp:Transcript_10528/g.23693  ORF Transcript_10528/g.23693 Transcript_10528/m.23693 type:complete len:894 (+) Transcript_10528:99-2780(+)
MGCCGSAFKGSEEVAPEPPSPYDVAYTLSVQDRNQAAHDRLVRLKDFDKSTKVPFILVELTGEGNGEGEIEICGKDEYGVYEALDEWLENQWGCERLDAGDLTTDTKVPFCTAQYRWSGFAVVGDEGLNNMGLMTMRLVDFMCGQLSWTLAMITAGNVGHDRGVREQQIIFKAPHPMNLVAPHMMIELRSAGFVELCADLDEEHRWVLDELDSFFSDRFQAELLEGHEAFCDRYYKAGEDVFKGVGGSSDSNFGLLTTVVCDKVAGLPGWSLVACHSGSYGESGEHVEQQLVFRRDEHPLGNAPYLLVVLNASGNIEVSGKKIQGVHGKLDRWLQTWGCCRAGQFREGEALCRKYTWEAKDMLTATAELVSFFEELGWEMQICSLSTVKQAGEQCREQQLLFRPCRSEVGMIEPHLFLELYAGEGKEDLYEDEEVTQVLANQHVRMRFIGEKVASTEVAHAQEKLKEFIVNYLGGTEGVDRLHCSIFMCRGKFENNSALVEMRFCDFMVDHLGWSFMVSSQCNLGEDGRYRLHQLVFRYDGDKREVPIAYHNRAHLDRAEWAETPVPEHWLSEAVQSGAKIQQVLKCTHEEIDALQQMFDSTFKRILTRDRRPDEDAPEDEEMPYRLKVVYAFRSEHAWLHHRFFQRRSLYSGEEQHYVKTSEPETILTSRLSPGDGYLYHGTNPSSAMSILKTGFVLKHAGSSTGTMFGSGVYMAECSSKSDEYGRDAGSNTYAGLQAMLVCRCFVGNPLVVHKSGNHVATAQAEGYDCVCGDRESVVGTYREFVFFDEAQLYPEYTVIYRRLYDKTDAEVPEEMRVPTSGTTGRYWQMRLGKEWKNVPPAINRLLLSAKKEGKASVVVKLKETIYIFNIEEKTGTNERTGNVVPMRAPMVS